MKRESEGILSELMSSQVSIDTLCVELCERIIDDIPANDPRWAEKTGKSLNTNFIISKQLNGKAKMHEYYINFLKHFQIWQMVIFMEFFIQMSSKIYFKLKVELNKL